MKKIFLALAAAVAAAGMLVSCGAKTDAAANNDGEETPDSVASVVCVLNNDSLLRPDMKVERVAVIDFNATWCGPCRMLAPSFDAVAEQLHGQADFYSVDVDDNRATATAFGVSGIPHIAIVTPDGKVASYVGLTLMNIADSTSVISEKELEPVETPEELTALLTPAFRTLVESYIQK